MIILLIALMFIFTLISCSKEPTEPYLTLIYNGFTHTTNLAEYKDNDTEKSYQGEQGNNYLRIRKNSILEYKSSKSEEKCTLLIQRSETKKKVKELALDTNDVDTTVPQGKYIYTFSLEWKNGSAKFIKLIEIQ